MKDISIFAKTQDSINDKTAKNKSKAMVFVDYEHWYISLHRMFEIKPNLKDWKTELDKRFDVKEIMFFADFSNQSLANEIPRIREITNTIIYTAPTGTGTHKKDFTDFIMLDYIYRKAMSEKNIDTFIIFSGDGHFSSVVTFLRNDLKKEVGIYGVKDAFSSQLQSIASWTETVPGELDIFRPYYEKIFTAIKSREGYKPTRKEIIKKVLENGRGNKLIAETAMDKLIEKNYIVNKDVHLDGKQTISAVIVNWKKAEEDGFYSEKHDEIDEVSRLRKIISSK